MNERTADHIRQTLEQAIVVGAYRDGSRLDEITLTEEFNVSRTPVREALQMLAASGLVELIPRRGAFVRHPTFVELVEMFEVMAALEAKCGQLAALRATNEQIERMQSVNDDCAKALEAADSEAYYFANAQFHQLLYEASGNGFLASECHRLHRRLQPFRRMQLRVRGRMAQSLSEHKTILAAINAGDESAAGQTLHDHIAIQGKRFHGLMASYQNQPSNNNHR